jgi:D-beta-D-heptose 7-phosphate kinase/D-beta-D-heptose 1-phosphate adenosyltransferase
LEKISEERFDQIFTGWGGHQIMVLGDLMLDEYLWGNVARISPEAPVPVVEVVRDSVKLGGAANVALNVKALGDEPILVGAIGKDRTGERLLAALGQAEIEADGIFADDGRTTTSKTRIIAHNQQVVRADRENTEEISLSLTETILDFVRRRIRHFSGVIISDYGKGVITQRLLSGLIELCRQNEVFVAVDPKDAHFFNYKHVSLITPNHHEAGFVYGKRIRDESTLREVGWGLLGRLKADALLITRGEMGMSLFEADRTLTHLPTEAKKVYDVTGAGDTVISAFTCAVAAKANFREAALISNHAAGLVVGQVGTAQATKEELINDLKPFINRKVKSLEQLIQIRGELRQEGRSVVFTNGCFDIFHRGHIELLKKAKSLGEVLIVALNSDSSVRKIKGEKRPVISQNDRAEIMASLEMVDYVMIFEEETPYDVIARLLPDVLVKGGDYKKEEVVGAEVVESHGGKVALIKLVPGKSTKNIIKEITERYTQP